ncbi:hypothetical protein J1N35_044237 [Gossypium stocksii]|uniref:Uncharacterized protein n=1 Tax=Gossypium stocksii TaxID=47602 RepID=A0A9D3ZG72_9ROSI|nr:hypothetical protein J1N35_044237 [Gossypium stocksii]
MARQAPSTSTATQPRTFFSKHLDPSLVSSLPWPTDVALSTSKTTCEQKVFESLEALHQQFQKLEK